MHRNNIRKKQNVWLFFVILLFVNFPASVFSAEDNKEHNIWNAVKKDYKQFYSRDHLIKMSFAFGVGAVMANTSIDENFQDWYQNHVRDSNTDDVAKVTEMMGEAKYLIPLSLASAVIGSWDNLEEDSAIFTWGVHTTRAYLVGGPAVLLMQRVVGASQPGETEEGSSWKPFDDDNGISGHAFIGAVPFLTLARMNEENCLIKYVLYTASTLAALSRINDNSHFLSQAALGWYLAWESVGATWKRDTEESKLTVMPFLTHDRYGVYFNLKW